MSLLEDRASGIRVDWIGVGTGKEREERERRRRGWSAGSRELKDVGRSDGSDFKGAMMDGVTSCWLGRKTSKLAVRR